MTVRDKEIIFLVACLDDQESAQENEDGLDDKSIITETSYAKRKKREEESSRQSKLSDKKQQLEILKEFMSTPDNSAGMSTPSSHAQNVDVQESVVQRNLASANEKKVNVLLKVMKNKTVFGMYSEEEQNDMKDQLKQLIANN